MNRLVGVRVFSSVFSHTALRWYSSSAAIKSSPLAVLRRKTGYPLSKIKSALNAHDNDIEAAEKWLKEQALKEGWAKAEMVQNRKTKMGLIGTLVRDTRGVMVEVNCETDFVARNQDFQQLVATITEAVYTKLATPATLSTHFDGSTLGSIGPLSNNHATMSDLLAQMIGQFGENITIPRGCVLSSSEGLLCHYVYNINQSAVPGSQVGVGTYASIVNVQSLDGEAVLDQVVTLGNKLSQHIVGLNPCTIEPVEVPESDEREPEVKEPGCGTEALLEQQLLGEEEVSVKDWLDTNRLKVLQFVRYAVGQTTNDN